MTQVLKSIRLVLTLSVCMIPAGCSKSVEEGPPQPVAGMPDSGSTPSASAPATPAAPVTAPVVADVDPLTSIFLGLTTTKPENWTPAILENAMQRVRYIVPGVEGEEPASLVIFSIGAGGEVQANIDRWAGQVTNPDGSPGEPKVEEFTVSDMTITLVELLGNYQGMGMAEAKSNQLFLSAIVDAPSGRIFIRLVGQEQTVEANRESYMAFLKGLKPAS